jgi:transcriptional regulator
MYVPKHFEEDRLDVLAAFMREHPFATLVSMNEGELIATHLPLVWDPDPAPFGTLTGHVARANPHGRHLATGVASLAIFHGPEGYVSPSWYPSKHEHGKVVPTWNYVAVHAYGELEVIDDVEWSRGLVTRLTEVHESTLPEPWRVTDSPEAYVAQLLKAILGLSIPVSRLEGKWKLGQNRPAADYDGAIAGLTQRGEPGSRAVAAVMAAHRDRNRSD